jgi:hypothetical protein
VFKGLDTKSIQILSTIDFYLNHLIFSLRSQDAAEQICRAWTQLGDVKKAIAPEVKQLSAFASALRVDRRTVTLKRKNRPKKDDILASGQDDTSTPVSDVDQREIDAKIRSDQLDEPIENTAPLGIDYMGEQNAD